MRHFYINIPKQYTRMFDTLQPQHAITCNYMYYMDKIAKTISATQATGKPTEYSLY